MSAIELNKKRIKELLLYAHVVVKTTNMVILRRVFKEDDKECVMHVPHAQHAYFLPLVVDTKAP